MINYKGKGEHSVNELEKIIEEQAEQLHLLKIEKQQCNMPVVSVSFCKCNCQGSENDCSNER